MQNFRAGYSFDSISYGGPVGTGVFETREAVAPDGFATIDSAARCQAEVLGDERPADWVQTTLDLVECFMSERAVCGV